MRLFLRHRMGDKSEKTRERSKLPEREFQGLTISRSREILPSRMLFRIPTFPAHSVSLSSRTDAAFWAREFTHFASQDFIAIHFNVRFMRRCVDVYTAHQVQKIGAIGRERCPSFIRETYPPELPRKFIWIYHRSLVNVHKGASSLRRRNEINRPLRVPRLRKIISSKSRRADYLFQQIPGKIYRFSFFYYN